LNWLARERWASNFFFQIINRPAACYSSFSPHCCSLVIVSPNFRSSSLTYVECNNHRKGGRAAELYHKKENFRCSVAPSLPWWYRAFSLFPSASPAASFQFLNTNLFYCQVNDLSSLLREDRLDGCSLFNYRADILRKGARWDLHSDVSLCCLFNDTFALRSLLIHGIKLGHKQKVSVRLDFRPCGSWLTTSPLSVRDNDKHPARSVANEMIPMCEMIVHCGSALKYFLSRSVFFNRPFARRRRCTPCTELAHSREDSSAASRQAVRGVQDCPDKMEV